MPVELNFTVTDGKGATSLVTFNLEDGFSVADYTELATALLATLKNISTGAYIKASLCVGLALVGLETQQDAGVQSDVEEGARFIWQSDPNFSTRVRLPTFDEALIVANSREVDIANPTVDSFLGDIEDGITTAGGVIGFTDYRGADIIALRSALESFQRSRR